MDIIYKPAAGTNRPVIRLDAIFPGCTALLDTGAIIPVWTKDVKLLQSLGASLVRQGVEFSGFGGKTRGDLYKINLTLDKIVYPGLPIVVHTNDNIPGYFIFSATMFHNMVYTIDNLTKRFILQLADNQVCHNLKVINTDGKTVVLINQ